MGFKGDVALNMIGRSPYTEGVGIFKKGSATRMEPIQCAMKRAEADAIKKRFDVEFITFDDSIDDAGVSELPLDIDFGEPQVGVDPGVPEGDMTIEVEFEDESYQPVGAMVIKKDTDGNLMYIISEDYDYEYPDLDFDDDESQSKMEEFYETIYDGISDLLSTCHYYIDNGKGISLSL